MSTTEAHIQISRVIVCAACMCNDDLIVLGVRHWDKYMLLQYYETNEKFSSANTVQGFVDNRGNFLNRMEAWAVAEEAGQIKRRVGSDGPEGKGLFSENLY